MSTSIVHRLHEDFSALVGLLDRAAEPSLRTTADDCFRKALLLAAASYFEVRVTDAILQFVKQNSAGTSLVPEFVRHKALARQYHALFDWDKNNANKFFSLFGQGFREYMEAKLKSDRELDVAVKAFLELGRERNRLVHQDFGNFPLEKTADEIFAAFERADHFVNTLPLLFNECPPRGDSS